MIHHGVDVEAFSPPDPAQPGFEPARNAAGTGTPGPLILSVGRLVEKKGFPDLFEAFRRLKEAGFAFNAAIYGDGPLRAELAAQIQESGLDGQVTLAGPRMQQELLPLFQISTMFALTPSLPADGDRDGIPNVLVEAMACGLPVVSTAVAGIPELVIHETNGLLFQPHDVEGIAAGLAALLRDEDQRKQMGEAARQTVLDRFDLKAGACQMAGLLQQIGTV
jgi:glycosyltransferase involved in cell wall biosynthesis